MKERERQRERFETSHTLLSAAHATATHSTAPQSACPSHVSASLEWANVSCVLSTVSPALCGRERDGERQSEGRAECDAKRVFKFCLAALPTSLLLLSVVAFFFVLLHNQRSFDCQRSFMCVCAHVCVCERR